MFNKDLTIINKLFNKNTKTNEYIINHIKGFWSSNEGIIISDMNLIKNDGFICRILLTEPNYETPKEFQNNHKGWTLKNDDYIVKGIINDITSISDLKDNYECMKITNISVKDYGSLDMQHFEVSGE